MYISTSDPNNLGPHYSFYKNRLYQTRHVLIYNIEISLKNNMFLFVFAFFVNNLYQYIAKTKILYYKNTILNHLNN